MMKRVSYFELQQQKPSEPSSSSSGQTRTKTQRVGKESAHGTTSSKTGTGSVTSSSTSGSQIDLLNEDNRELQPAQPPPGGRAKALSCVNCQECTEHCGKECWTNLVQVGQRCFPKRAKQRTIPTNFGQVGPTNQVGPVHHVPPHSAHP